MSAREPREESAADVSPVPVERLVMGARLRVNGEQGAVSPVGYSVGALAAVMKKWSEQPYRRWLTRELGKATGLSRDVVIRVVRDLMAAGHATCDEGGTVKGYAHMRDSYVLTPAGREAWDGVALEAPMRNVAPHQRAKPRTPRL